MLEVQELNLVWSDVERVTAEMGAAVQAVSATQRGAGAQAVKL
jgi:hypothetical protein